MTRATAGAAAGVVRTRQKAAAAAAIGQSSSSVESQHTTCAQTSNPPGSPASTHHSRAARYVSKLCNKQLNSKQQHNEDAQQAANARKRRSDLPHSLEEPTAAKTQQQIAKERASGARSKLRQVARDIQQQQRDRHPASPTIRSGSRSATAAAAARGASAAPQSSGASAPHIPQLDGPQDISPCRTSRHPTVALVEAAEAADLVACLCNGMSSQDHGAAESRRETKLQQDRHQQQPQMPTCLQQNAPTAVPAAAAAAAPRRRSKRLADLNDATSPTPPAAAVAVVQDDTADQSSSHLAAYSLPPPLDAATAEATPNAVQAATTIAAAQEEDVDAADHPPTSLRARFSRLSAEQQLNILLELEQLTQLEETCNAKQVARRAAAEAREKEKEIARQHKRRSGRLHQTEAAGTTYPEGGASRSSTPQSAHTRPPKPAAATAEAPNSKRIRRFDGLWLPIMTSDCCNTAQLRSKWTRGGEHSGRERASSSPGLDALKQTTLEGW